MPTAPTGWFEPALRAWQDGRRVEAIQACFAQARAEGGFRRPALSLQTAYYLFQIGDHEVAARVLGEQACASPDHEEVLLNLGVLQSRLGRSSESVAAMQAVLRRNPGNAVAWDGLCAELFRTGDRDGARQAGEQALLLKDRLSRSSASAVPARTGPAPAGTLQVVSFSLWGDDPRYLRGALRNALLVPEIYPGWRARFYLDASVPEPLCEALSRLGAELCVEAPGQSLRQKLLWRAQVVSDPAVSHYLIRDADAVVSLREALAVREWLASGRAFHVLRDWWTHTDLILAGLWGGRGGSLPSLTGLAADYRPPHAETANIDQWFLRDRIWPLIRDDCLIHDRLFRVLSAQPFPDPDPEGDVHVGQNEFAACRERQVRWLGAWIERLPCLGGPA